MKKWLKTNTNEVNILRSARWQETRQIHNTGEVQPGTRKGRKGKGCGGHWGVSTALAVELQGVQVQDGRPTGTVTFLPGNQ